MRAKDLQRIFKGVGMVAQEMVVTQAPNVSRKLRQNAAHVAELARLAPTMFDHKDDPHSHEHDSESKHPGPAHPKKHRRPRPGFDETDAKKFEHHPDFRERHVPAGPFARVMGFSQLAAGLAVGTVNEVVKRTVGLSTSGPDNSYVMNEANAERLAATLCRMRGAALKLGQMLSIQDETLLPDVWRHVLERVRQQADIMPKKQLHKVLAAELGEDWADNFAFFDETPLAAASIGQVHHATLASGEHLAVKVQYPGVAQSIDSDLDNLKRVLAVANVFPKGLYIDNIIEVAREELRLECDYLVEASNQQIYRKLIMDDPLVADDFVVPKVYPELCTSNVLTTELIPGGSIDKAKDLSQETRNELGQKLLQLTLQELFVYRFMQTDPNWGNFLYDDRRELVGLLDFGATRTFPKHFVDDYLRLVKAAADGDRAEFEAISLRMGFLTGHESQQMIDAHCDAGMLVGAPFMSYEPHDFKKAAMAAKVTEHAQVFASQRLTPPPKEVYSLHRRLSGAFMMCIHLDSKFEARTALERTWESYDWGSEE